MTGTGLTKVAYARPQPGGAPSSQVCMNMPTTRWPTLTRVTPGPTASTTPTASDNGTRGSGIFGLPSSIAKLLGPAAPAADGELRSDLVISIS